MQNSNWNSNVGIREAGASYRYRLYELQKLEMCLSKTAASDGDYENLCFS